jgi:hypothetical protein
MFAVLHIHPSIYTIHTHSRMFSKKVNAFEGAYNNATDPVAANTCQQPTCAFER